MILSIDQASNKAGCSLWSKAGQLHATAALTYGNPADPYSRRLQGLAKQLESWLLTQPTVTQIIFETTKPKLVLASVGAFLTAPSLNVKLHETASFVSPSTWKKWAQLHGATGAFKLIKGVKALRETGFDVDGYGIDSEDVADSVLIYLAWRERKC